MTLFNPALILALAILLPAADAQQPAAQAWNDEASDPGLIADLAAFEAITETRSADASAEKPGQETETQNVGIVLYTKSRSPGTLNAIWNFGNAYSGPGLATGGPEEGFAGRYHVRYFLESGAFSDEYDLVIEKSGDFYNVSWIVDGTVRAVGVGLEVEGGLAVGWRRVAD